MAVGCLTSDLRLEAFRNVRIRHGVACDLYSQCHCFFTWALNRTAFFPVVCGSSGCPASSHMSLCASRAAQAATSVPVLSQSSDLHGEIVHGSKPECVESASR